MVHVTIWLSDAFFYTLISFLVMADELILFVETAYKLEKSTFWQWATQRRGASDMGRIIAGDWLSHDGLSPEALDSFCLTLRLLIQDQDGFSIRKINSLSEEWQSTYAIYREAIQHATQDLNGKLNSRSLVQFRGREETTNRDVFDTIFYGGIVHLNPAKRELFRRLRDSGLFSFFLFQSFVGILFHYRNCIQAVAFNIVRYLEAQPADASESYPTAPEGR
ncbi:MAG: hypothetical protein H6R19_956 [Proteobacteria bacterium]|nr:hypothetical protein [Pseudomonadota bacterium]